MSIKVIQKPEKKEDGIKYPCLMISKQGQILLVTKIKGGLPTQKRFVGTNINGVGYHLGFYSDNWSTLDFDVYEGSITLSNTDN